MPSTCIFPGHFQPFHKGHLMVVQGMVKTCGQAVIVICHGPNSERSVDKVREDISTALLDENIVDATIVEVTDGPTDDQWVDKVIEAAGHPQDPMIWSGKEEIRAMFEKHGIKTKKIVPVPGV